MLNHPIFDDNWLTNARAKSSSDSWANEAVEMLDTTGQIYLSTLRLWFDRFPLSDTKERQHLRVRLESLKNEDHLGGVNELAWWAFMQREGIAGKPLPTSSTPRPDFQLQPPADCFVEVSTLNVSDQDKATFQSGNSVALDEAETIRRIILKASGKKKRQLFYTSNCKKSRRACSLRLHRLERIQHAVLPGSRGFPIGYAVCIQEFAF
jgi:hypothetical protein